MNKILAAIFAFVMVLALASCSSEKSKDDECEALMERAVSYDEALKYCVEKYEEAEPDMNLPPKTKMLLLETWMRDDTISEDVLQKFQDALEDCTDQSQ